MQPNPQPQPDNQSGLFTTDGRQYDLFRPATAAPLPAATFVLRAAPMRGFYLDKVEDLPVPERIYGIRRGRDVPAARRRADPLARRTRPQGAPGAAWPARGVGGARRARRRRAAACARR